MNDIILSEKDTDLLRSFRWRARDGTLLAPKDMATRHLFFTLRMIWNHTMPEEARSSRYIRYEFGSYYTRPYMIQAVYALGWELKRRDDISPAWRRELLRMSEYLRSKLDQHPPLLEKP